ncbi:MULTISPECIES: DUF1840 domain-containing protein [unclassified Variovorax]|uniref:DUF1840 domain-containing protein n=1 Tax=unclassified Variovorax TaxID=663243 RepID=UPI001BD39D73|nr:MULTISPECIES: DUF1840 domain-containing protein [unclassified Variovorax]
MLYRFKSQATQDVVMLEANARQLLEIMGKSGGGSGIITVEQIPSALAALEAAVRTEGTNRHNHDALAVEGHAEEAERQHIGLHQRAAPIIHMLKDAQADGKDVIWGAK